MAVVTPIQEVGVGFPGFGSTLPTFCETVVPLASVSIHPFDLSSSPMNVVSQLDWDPFILQTP